MMTPKEFTRLCHEIVGDRTRGAGAWQGRTARGLCTTAASVRNWSSGRIAISDQLAAHVMLWHEKALRERASERAANSVSAGAEPPPPKEGTPHD